MAIQLVWYKRDLRIADHAPLAQAAKAGGCVGLYVYEPELIEAEDFDAAHLHFINESLVELRDKLRHRGNELLLRTGTMPELKFKINSPNCLLEGFEILCPYGHAGSSLASGILIFGSEMANGKLPSSFACRIFWLRR